MNIDIHVHHHSADSEVLHLLTQILAKLETIETKETAMARDIKDVLTDAEAAAKAESDAEDAVIALLTTLAAEVTDLKNSLSNLTDPTVVERMQALADGLNARKAVLAAAVVANTPAQPDTPPATP